ncbi:MAG: 50S ribosomal protein L25/general stress protein Ctc [Bacteroidia bacterium]|nr:50S ribosomal protein L25/general stress protein Ctc [Bacteroidia bacterium]MCZ2248340.1 50S ribosomal protein L25/general stress protein Ctc [Bacteroidia bacterium]
MKSVSISGSLRANVGKKDAKALRGQGMVPCVLYGGQEQKIFQVKYNDLLPLVYTPEVLTVELNIDGKKINALMQEIQFHPVNDRIIHIDFLEIFDNKPVVIDIPVTTEGNSIGVRAGGKLVLNVRKLKVRGLPGNLPDKISINIDNLDLGGVIRVSEVQVKDLELLDTPNMVIVAVKATRNTAGADAKAPAKK